MDSIIPGLSISICIVTFFFLFISSHFYAWLAMTLYSPLRDPQFYRLHMPARHNKGGIRHFVQSLREGLNEKKRFLSGIARITNPPPMTPIGQLGPLFSEVEIQDLKVSL